MRSKQRRKQRHGKALRSERGRRGEDWESGNGNGSERSIIYENQSTASGMTFVELKSRGHPADATRAQQAQVSAQPARNPLELDSFFLLY